MSLLTDLNKSGLVYHKPLVNIGGGSSLNSFKQLVVGGIACSSWWKGLLVAVCGGNNLDCYSS